RADAGLADAEAAPAPRLVLRLLGERRARRAHPSCKHVDVLRRAAIDPEALALHAAAALLPVVLAEPEGDASREGLDALQSAIFLPLVLQGEAEHVPVEGDALVDVVDREARARGTEPKALGLLAALVHAALRVRHRLRGLARGLGGLLLDLLRDR